MGLIKASASQPTTVRFHLRDIEAESRSRIERATAEADLVIAQAKERAAQIEANAAEIGLAQGIAEGREEGLAAGREEAVGLFGGEIQLAISALTQAADAMEASRAALSSEALNDVVRLAIAVAERVTKRQGVVDPAVLRENLREVINMLVHRDDIAIAIHPSQRTCLDELLPKLQLEWPQLRRVEIVEDARVLPGGCRVSGGRGEIDADLQTQLDRIVVALLPSAGRSNGSGRGVE